MLAYVFWHWRSASNLPANYQKYLRSFHETLAANKPEGFLASTAFTFASLPWLNSADSEVYEDWYFVKNAAALDPLDEAAVHGPRKGPHDQVALQAAGGTGGLYRLRAGQFDPKEHRMALWFSKPTGMSYDTLYSVLEERIHRYTGSLWQRQMTLGPALEFCWHAPQDAALPAEFPVLTFPLTPIWPA